MRGKSIFMPIAFLLSFMSGAAQAQADEQLTIVHFSPPTSGWAIESVDAYAMMRFGCLEGLTAFDKDQKLIPWLAESWEQVDEKKWHFKLRQGVVFQDGSPFNADAVVTAFNHVLAAKVPARSLNRTVVSSVGKVDDRTVEIVTQVNNPLLPLYLTTPSAGVLSPKAYTGELTNPFGTCTGPFTFASETAKQKLNVVRNDTYWGDKAKIAGAQIRFIVDPATRATQVRSGEADLVMELPVAVASRLRSANNVELVVAPISRVQSMIFNTKKAPFDNALVRRAVQRAVDVNLVAKGLYEGLADPATGPFAPGQPWRAEDRSPVAFDLDGAKALLKEAGIDPAGITIDLAVANDFPEFVDMAVVVQQSLKALGFNAEIRGANYAGLEADLLGGKFDMTVMSRNILTDVRDPIAFLKSDLACGGSFNVGQVCIPELDALIKSAEVAVAESERYAIYQKIDRYLQDQAIQLFLVYVKQIDARNKKLSGYAIDPVGFKLLTPAIELK